jgi:hypothetical protein
MVEAFSWIGILDDLTGSSRSRLLHSESFEPEDEELFVAGLSVPE